MKREATQKKRRELTRHELDLWLHVTRDVQKRRSPPPLIAEPNEPMVEVKQPRPASARAVPPPPSLKPAPPAARAPAAMPPLAPLEPKVRRRLSRRQLMVDAALDLHGMRQDQAHRQVRHFLHDCHDSGARIALIVTGKGAPSGNFEPDDFRRTGVLRQIVPQWLREPDLRKFVIGFEEAAPSQGGYGALYVRIRRSDRHL